MINDPAYPKPNHCDNCGDVLDVHYGEWYREECYCKTCGLPLCRDCYDEHLWDDHMIPEVRREFELLQAENSDLLRKSNRAIGLLKNLAEELGPDGYDPIYLETYDTEIIQGLVSFLRELEGK